MFSYIWPLILVVFSNTIYQICTSSVPEKMDPFASLTITYLVAAFISGILYFVLGKHGNLFKEYANTNWAPFLLGLVIIGLEVGYIFLYKAGWPVSIAATAQSAILAVVLLVVGFFLYNEALSPSKIIGVGICLIGLYFINK